jgi:hypothetical protein
MDKAESSPGGAFVNMVAYQADYTAAQEQLKALDATARSKKCALR